MTQRFQDDAGSGDRGDVGGAAAGVGENPVPVSDDRLLNGRVRLKQPRTGYRVAIDPVFLAASVAATAGERVLDAGCGVGAAALCLAQRIEGVAILGLDRDPALTALATANAAANGASSRVAFITGDLRQPPAACPPAGFDRVMTNPPFLAPDRIRPAADAGRRAAMVEDGIDLAGWIEACGRMLRPGGSLTLIHRASRLDEILAALGVLRGGLAIFPLWPGGRDNKPAQRLLIQAWRQAGSGVRLLPGMVLHRADGRFTDDAEAILRAGAAIPW